MNGILHRDLWVFVSSSPVACPDYLWRPSMATLIPFYSGALLLLSPSSWGFTDCRGPVRCGGCRPLFTSSLTQFIAHFVLFFVASISLRVASSRSAVSTAPEGKWTYRTTDPRINMSLVEHYQLSIWFNTAKAIFPACSL